VPARWLAAVALLPALVPFLPLGSLTAPTEAACQRPPSISFFDQGVGSEVEVRIADRTITFTAPEGNTYTGANARIRDDGRHLDASYVSRAFSVVLRADLTYGRARAQASELVAPPEPRPVPHGAIALLRRSHIRLWTLTVLGGPPQEGDCRPSVSPTPAARA
jgi:hypothetical protein